MISKNDGIKDEACEKLCKPYRDLQSELKELEARLEERKKVEKAKWILIKAKGIDEDEAHRLLINHSRANRKKLSEMADIIIDGDALFSCKKK